MRDERRNYLVAGGFVVAMLVALLVWIALLSGRMWGADPYHVHFARVHGLAAGTKVFFDGYPVGRIERIEVGEGNRRFRVDLRIRDGWVVPQDSRAQVLRGIFSGVVLDIRGGSSATPIPHGGEIPGDEGGDVFADVQSVARKVDAMFEELRPVIAKAAEGGPDIVENLRSLTAELDRAADRLGKLLSAENTERVGRALANVEETSENLAGLTRDLESTRAGLDGVVARVGELVDEDRGDVSEALRDLNHSLAAVARHIDAIAADLETSSRNLAEFTRGVREDPGVLLRGRERAGDGGQP